MSSLFWLVFTLALAWAVDSEATVRYTTSTARGALSTGTCPDVAGQRCTNARALSLSVSGDVVVMEGNTMASPYVYQGANDMLASGGDGGGLVTGKSGSAGSPITVRCATAGGCLIDGQFARTPLRLNGNSYWTFEDFNVKNANSPVIYLTGSANNWNIFRRLIAWDAKMDQNFMVTSSSGSSNNLYEDFASFGTSRKAFDGSFGGSNNTICRRCWIRWDGGTTGGSMGGTVFYRSSGVVWENVIVSWSGVVMPETYTVTAGSPNRTNFEPYGGTAVLSSDRWEATAAPKNVNVAIRGSISYIKADAHLPTVPGGGATNSFTSVQFFGASAITITDLVSVISPQHPRFNLHQGIVLVRRPHNCPCQSPLGSAACILESEQKGCLVSGTVQPDHANFVTVGNTANRITSIRGTMAYGTNVGDSFGRNGVANYGNETDWTVTGLSAGTSLQAVQSPWQNTSTNGARLCYRWGTTTPLWPWPMNDRILEATKQAGKYAGPCTINCRTGGLPWMSGANNDQLPVQMGPRTSRVAGGTDVTAEIESLLGQIPATCRSGAPLVSFPPAPTYAPPPLTSF